MIPFTQVENFSRAGTRCLIVLQSGMEQSGFQLTKALVGMIAVLEFIL